MGIHNVFLFQLIQIKMNDLLLIVIVNSVEPFYILLPVVSRHREPSLCCFKGSRGQQIKKTDEQHQEWMCVLHCKAVEQDMSLYFLYNRNFFLFGSFEFSWNIKTLYDSTKFNKCKDLPCNKLRSCTERKSCVRGFLWSHVSCETLISTIFLATHLWYWWV